MSILARIRANGGNVTRNGHQFAFQPGRMSQAAIAWVKGHGRELRREIWPAFDDWEERAAIREFDGGQDRAEAEAAAFAEVSKC